MSTRPPVVLFLVGVAGIVATIGWWVGNSALHADAQPVAYPPALDERAHSTEPVDPLPSPTRIATDAPLEVADDGFGDEDLWAHISDPVNSDLPPVLFAELTQLGADIMRADATGEGRDRWPHYWRDASPGRVDPCCVEVVIHAAGAFTHPADRSHVKVTVVWAAAGVHSDSHRVRVGEIWLARDGKAWSPTRR